MVVDGTPVDEYEGSTIVMSQDVVVVALGYVTERLVSSQGIRNKLLLRLLTKHTLWGCKT